MKKEFWKLYLRAWGMFVVSLLLAFLGELGVFIIWGYKGYWSMGVIGFLFGLVQLFTCYLFYRATLLLPIRFLNKFLNIFSRVLFFGVNIIMAYIILGLSVLIFILSTGIAG